MQRVKHDFQVANQEILFGNVYMIQNGFTFFRSEFMFKVQTINCMQYSEPVLIGHFRVPKTLTFKMRPSAQPFCENDFYLHENEKSFPYQRLSI